MEGETSMIGGIGCYLRVKREAYGMSLAELARRINLSRQTLSSIEHGRVRPKAEDVGNIARVLGIGEEELGALLLRLSEDDGLSVRDA
jgi:transcriptional regulator with XRE-family HTH domain